ncbi:hypothetical protein XELAEV_18026920mg [Xenopus laevis]|uniref:Uncharacterized protein n=1 Tax=Xenopus laevis TaxID=8355 RepID=A0A974CUN2_XENLA|nr:hypothetical protein XELAEV_18026920mg [Xenopus laevis]
MSYSNGMAKNYIPHNSSLLSFPGQRLRVQYSWPPWLTQCLQDFTWVCGCSIEIQEALLKIANAKRRL